MAAEGKVPVLETVKAGFAHQANALRTIGPAAVLAAAISALVEAAADAEGNALTPVAFLLFFGITIAYNAFNFRLALRKDASGVFGLKFGRDELNLAGAYMVTSFFFFIVTVPCIVAFGLAMGVAAKRGNIDLEGVEGDPEASMRMLTTIFTGPDAPMIWAVVVAALCLLLWLMARLALSPIATIGEQRVMVFSTWGWTRGNALRVLAALLLITLPIAFATTIVAGLVGKMMGLTATSQGMTGAFGARVFVQFLQGLGQFIFLTPAISGAIAHLYGGLRPPNWTPPAKS